MNWYAWWQRTIAGSRSTTRFTAATSPSTQARNRAQTWVPVPVDQSSGSSFFSASGCSMDRGIGRFPGGNAGAGGAG